MRYSPAVWLSLAPRLAARVRVKVAARLLLEAAEHAKRGTALKALADEARVLAATTLGPADRALEAELMQGEALAEAARAQALLDLATRIHPGPKAPARPLALDEGRR